MASETEAREEAMAQVYRTIDRARLTWRTVEAVDGLIRTFIVGGGALIVGLVVDNLLHLPSAVRLAYVALLLAAVLGLLGRLVFYPLFRRLNDEMVAAHLERSLPDLDNRIINAVLLYRERFPDRLARRMVDSQLSSAARWVSGRRLPRPPEVSGLWRPGRWAIALLAALVLYGALFSTYFGNAFRRLIFPTRDIPPITDTRLEVSPGDAEVLQGDSVTVKALVRGVLPPAGDIQLRGGGTERRSDAMVFRGNAFFYRFANVQKGFSYRISAGDALTPWYTIEVRTRPEIASLTLTYNYPDYTGLAPKTVEDATGDVQAPVGTEIALAATLSRPVRKAHILFETLDRQGAMDAAETLPLLETAENILEGRLRVERSGRYTIHLEDVAGIANLPRPRHVEAVPDLPPRVNFVKPARDVSVGPEGAVTLLAAAEDDFSLRQLHLLVQPEAGADWEKLRSWNYDPGTALAREGAVLRVQDLGIPVGGTLAYYMQANDGLRRTEEEAGRSRIYHVRVTEGGPTAPDAAEAREALRDVIRRLIEVQESNLTSTRALRAPAGERPDWDAFQRAAQGLVQAEESIYTQASDAVTTYSAMESSNLTEALARIAAGPVSEAVELLKDLQATRESDEVAPRSEAAAGKEEEVLSLLRQLLDDPAAALGAILQKQGQSEQIEERPEDLTGGEQLAERLLEAIKDFQNDQRRVIELSNQLAETPVDDFTEEDEKKLNEILETERKWTEFFQEAATDLSKLPPQDFSLSTQAKEFLEVFSEIQQAIEAGEREAIEMAVPHEQAGLELAEEIETNIEKWLMETKDDQLWSMEDPLEDYETPITELPDELQDLIGDLVESEEDMLEQFDDITSGWMDSLDMGAGWGTMDGPISNMSAKGVTGNRLPNTQEVGGRSGEGRTGKSSGQFVEEVATGKGGRQTPSRLTPDPFEAGSVDDQSGEAATGATGGGKLSGMGEEGFQGPVPPPLQQKLKRMALQQQQLIDAARHLDYGLKKYRHPRGRLPETIELMEAQKRSLAQGEVSTFGHYQKVVLSNLREVKELTDKQKQLTRDRSALLPKRLRDEISAARSESVPDEYREMVRNYFRALSETEVHQPEGP